jgi:regulator of replication initiation timing
LLTGTLNEELESLEVQLEEQMTSSSKLLQEKKSLMQEMEDLRQDLGEANMQEVLQLHPGVLGTMGCGVLCCFSLLA